LPKEEFKKLKESIKEKTKRYKMVTVLFSNILGFTKVAEQEDANRLVDDIDRFFFKFDEVVKKLHIEKLKTIGDSYMCAGGIPEKNRTNPIEVVLAAFEMQQYLNSIKAQYIAKKQEIWNLRIGIHTGPVFCNSTKNKKKLEVWGDTVNIASRMEASGEVGKVNITGMTYELVKDYFICQYRGKMPVKYKGEIDMYFIEGFRPALSIDGTGLKPNKIFTIRLGLVRFDDLEEHVLNLLENNLPNNLYYHNLKHTIDVTVQVELIGRQEDVSDEEMLLLKTAALFHDTGFIRTYKNHEAAGVEIAKEILPKFDYSEEQIEKICKLILITKLPPKPTSLLEQIICDADLDYLGRVDFIPVSETLFRELKEHNIIEDNINKWNEIQIKFIEGHQYFTETAKRLRDVNKNNQLELIRKLVAENN
jgi:class 3 adenylate cyclase/HD superfamily phosphodiesterase